MKKIKVLFALPNLKTAGSGREMLNIVERLDKDVFEAWVGVQEAGGPLFDEIISKRIPVVVQPFKTEEKLNLLTKIRKAKKYAKDFKPMDFNIWQSFNWSSDFSEAFTARWAGAKYLYVKKNMNWGRKAWTTKSMLSSGIIARNTTMLETFFSSKKYRKKVHLIHGGVDTMKFKPQFDMSARQQFGIPDNAFLLVNVAQLVRSKDHVTLINALSRVPEVHLVIAGAERDVDYKEELKSIIEEKQLINRVHFAGSITDINNLLNAANAFVLSTSTYLGHEEGSPVAVLEAMAAGVPCIVSNVAGNRDLIENEKTGLVFKVGNVDALADCIREYVSKPTYSKKLAEKAMDKVYSEYTIEHEVRNFEEVYKKLMRYK